jgi:hypothetical protein
VIADGPRGRLHPRTAYLLREEAALWARQGVLLLKLD